MGALADGSEHDEFRRLRIDTASWTAGVPTRLFVAGGGSECPEGPFCAAGSAMPCGKAGCPSPCRSRPWLSVGFPRVPFVPSRRLSRLRGSGTPRAAGCGAKPPRPAVGGRGCSRSWWSSLGSGTPPRMTRWAPTPGTPRCRIRSASPRPRQPTRTRSTSRPRAAPQLVDHRGELAVGGHHLDRLVEPVAAGFSL